jgi:hypothetical protein
LCGTYCGVFDFFSWSEFDEFHAKCFAEYCLCLVEDGVEGSSMGG